MSDEEKKAYDNLIMLKYFTMEKEDKQAIDTILNLIEKQSKEIEELKAINKKLEARKYMLNAETGEISQIPIDNNYISNEKIKAKIEEYRHKDFIKMQVVMKHDKEALKIAEVLQSLLEKE